MSSKINILIRLFETIEKRANEDSTKSYTAQLLSEGKEKCIAKVREEASVVVVTIASGETVISFVLVSSGVASAGVSFSNCWLKAST